MEDLISIVVPIYNVERYLDKCVKSILDQTYKNLEVVLVDDGSTDKSSQICDEWKGKDNRIKVIHQENQGVSVARNVGIENSTGEWITFSDNDDYMDSDLIENLYKSAKENEADIAVGGHFIETYYKEFEVAPEKCFVTNSEEMIKRLYTGKGQTFVWGKLFKKKLFDNIRFPAGKIGEDVAVLYKLYDKAERISNIDKSGYHWIQRGSSLGHRKFARNKVVIIDFIEDMEKLVKTKYPNIYEDIERYVMVEVANYTILCYKHGFKEEYEALKKNLKVRIAKSKKNHKIKFKTRKKSFLIAYCGFSRFYKPIE